MSLETVTLDHLPSSYKIHLALFRDVQNSEFLHQQLLARNSDFEYAFVDASVVSYAIHSPVSHKSAFPSPSSQRWNI